MKRICFFSILSLLCANIKAQNYLNLTTANVTSYSINPAGVGYSYEGELVHTVARDTLIDGVQYFEIYQEDNGSSYPNNDPSDITYYSNEGPLGFYRIDDRKFYKYILSQNSDYLIYDYNLSIGDTAHFLNCYEPPIVINIDTVPIGNQFRKRFHFSGGVGSYAQPSLVEGAGTNLSFLHFHCNPTWEQGYNLRCHAHNNEVLYNPSNSRCEEFVGLSSEIDLTDEILVYPNPFIESIQIQLSEIRKYKYEIYTMSGQFLMKGEIDQSDHYMNLKRLIPGTYIIRMVSPEWVTTRRLVKSQ